MNFTYPFNGNIKENNPINCWNILKRTISSQASILEEGSTTMNVKFSRMQAIGIRSGAPLTHNGEGDDIVYALMKIRGCYNAAAQG